MNSAGSSSTRHRQRIFRSRHHKREPSNDNVHASQRRPSGCIQREEGCRASNAVYIKNSPGSLNHQHDYNLLILGETGVGKSTFINAFINYLAHSTLDEAVDGKLITLIPNSFVITDENLQTVTVSNGRKTKDEDFTAGQSATQSTKVYKFTFNDAVIRLIDTPGIGDVRGALQDNKNFEQILYTIGSLKKLHGIIILLKSNSARLTVAFRYCLDELLTRLHLSAKKNIIFGFTNSRGSNFRPGDTMPALLEHLSKIKSGVRCPKDKVYCFDSEGYRFLAAHAHGVSFDEELVDSYRNSWLYSVKETRRLLAFIAQMKPHATHGTLALNNARLSILQLTKPMAEITKRIALNSKVLEEENNRMARLIEEGQKLRKDLTMDKIIYHRKELDFIRTVCTNSACVKVISSEGQTKINYVTLCHAKCKRSKVRLETTNDAALIHCAAMGGTRSCRRCGHYYGEHMHVNFELQEMKVKVENGLVRKLFDANFIARWHKSDAMDELQLKVDQLKEEHRMITETAAQIGSFVQRGAIIAYSDARIDYLNFLIKEERNKKIESRDEKLLNALEDALGIHTEELKVIKQSIRAGNQCKPLWFDKIERSIAQLAELEHFGHMIQQMKRIEFEPIDNCDGQENYDLINIKSNISVFNIFNSPAQITAQKGIEQAVSKPSREIYRIKNDLKLQTPKVGSNHSQENDTSCRGYRNGQENKPPVLVTQGEGEKIQGYILRCLLSFKPGMREQDRVDCIINGLQEKFLKAAYSQDFKKVFLLRRHLIDTEDDALDEQ